MFNLLIHDYKVKLYNLTIIQYKKYYNHIMTIFENDNIFCSVTKNVKSNYFSLFVQICDLTNILDNDISIVHNIIACNDIFIVFSIYECENGINNFGIVSNISSIFSKYNLPIIYINTFNENLIFINENDYEKAIECITILIDWCNITIE